MNTRLFRHLGCYNLEPASPETQNISSHWAVCLERLKVITDGGGRVAAVSSNGTGLDTCERTGSVDTFLDACGMFGHWVALPWKAAILRSAARAIRVCRAARRPFNFDVYRQLYCLETVRRAVSRRGMGKRLNFLMIGDGYGILSALIKSEFPDSTVFLVDLGKVLFLQADLCQRVYPDADHRLYDEIRPGEQADFVYCPAEHLETLAGTRFDVATNIVSMHEMRSSEVRRYFDFMRRTMAEDNLFYCCNREYKLLRGGDGERFENYPWEPADEFLVDEPCPWHRYFLSRRPSGGGLRVAGLRVPCTHSYGVERQGLGPVRHRLSRLALRK